MIIRAERTWGADGLVRVGILASCLSGCASEVSLGNLPEEVQPPFQGSCRFEPSTQHVGGGRIDISVGTFWRQTPDTKGRDFLELQASATGGRVTVTLYKSRRELLTNLGIQPVDVFQVNGGSDVLQFALDSSLPRVCPLNQLYDAYGIRDDYFAAAWEPVTCSGWHYALPLNVHRVNTVMVNTNAYENLRNVAASAGVSVPPFRELESQRQLMEVLELAHDIELTSEDGHRVVPVSICLGGEPGDGWPLSIIAFENFLASYENAYESIWQGDESLTRYERIAAIAQLVADLQRLKAVSSLAPSYDPECNSQVSDIPAALTWQRAAELVRTGEALMTIGGDWLRAQIPEADRGAIATYPFPGQSDTFVYTPDTFAAQYQEDGTGTPARLWLMDVIDDHGTQVGFARAKQAIPAISKLDEDELRDLGSDYLEQNYAKFKSCHEEDASCRLLLAVSGLSPAAGTNECFDRLDMIVSGSIGVQYSEEHWEGFEEDCGWPVPRNVEESTQALIDLLVFVSENPYAKRCWE